MKRKQTQTRSLNTEAKLIAIGAKVDPELHAKIKDYAQQHNMSMALLIEEALTEYIVEEKEND